MKDARKRKAQLEGRAEGSGSEMNGASRRRSRVGQTQRLADGSVHMQTESRATVWGSWKNCL